MPTKVYVAGPYTPDPKANVRIAIEWAEELLRLGFYPFIPHLSHYWHAVHPHDYEVWLDYDLEWLKACDCVFRFGGQSPGADREIAYAEKLGKSVYYDLNDLLDGET